MSANGHKRLSQGNENILELDCNDDYSSNFTKKKKIIVHLNWTDFIVCNLYLKIAVKNTDIECEGTNNENPHVVIISIPDRMIVT